MDDAEFKAMEREFLESRRKLAIAMLEGFAAGSFEQPHTSEDIADWQKELDECNAALAEMDDAQKAQR